MQFKEDDSTTTLNFIPNFWTILINLELVGDLSNECESRIL